MHRSVVYSIILMELLKMISVEIAVIDVSNFDVEVSGQDCVRISSDDMAGWFA